MRHVSLLAAALALPLVACIPANDDPHPVAKALPRAEDVQIKLPDNAGAKPGTDVLGETSPWYVVTRQVTRDLNGGTAWVLIVVHSIVQFPPTSHDGDSYTWGPWDGSALDPARYRLVVTELADGSYDWTLDGQSKTQADADFETIISGNAVPGDTEGTGTGDFTIDFDAAERVNPIDNDARGVVAVTYDLPDRHLDMSVSTVEIRDGVEVPVDYEYAYTEGADRAGDMTFAFHGDTDDEGTAAEDAVIRSRWLATGAGRADVRITSGDLGDLQVTASECWDTSFAQVYYADSGDFVTPEGDEANCAFATSDLP
ncbi:MAG: hypothetical protein H6708_08760 [Kofleriaceae bacterium]|nr:hypothetical protein [Myxococcales bacterium]MCB9560488.1 hypothetical protein [Kofleriaceae bacterium]